MKTDRRHELRENDLAHMLSTGRKYFHEKGQRLALIVVAAAIVFGAVTVGVRSRASGLEDAQRQRERLSFEDVETGKQSLESLEALTREVSDERFVLSSLVEQGRQALRLAREAPVSPDRELNEVAGRAFSQLLERFADNPLAVGIARSGLATVEENAFLLNHDAVHKERARAHLTAIMDDAALNGMPFQRMASDRLATLDSVLTPIVYAPPPPPEEPVPTTPEDVTPLGEPVDEAGAAEAGGEAIEGQDLPVGAGAEGQQDATEDEAGKVDEAGKTGETAPPDRADDPQ